MNRIHPHSSGLAFGIFGLWHNLLADLVWIVATQWLLDFIFRLHMITPPYKIAGFGTALSMVLVTTCIGYAVGLVMGIIWNRLALRSTGDWLKSR